MKNKLTEKLKDIASQGKVVLWNGGFIKRINVGQGAFGKPFQCNNKKYKIELEVSIKCDNSTNFIPAEPEIKVIDWRNGKGYIGLEKIAEFLEISIDEVKEIYNPMIEKCVFSPNDIENTIKIYNDAVKSFREMFCLD